MFLDYEAQFELIVCVCQPFQRGPSTSSLGYFAYAVEQSCLCASLRTAREHVKERHIVLLLRRHSLCYRVPVFLWLAST